MKKLLVSLLILSLSHAALADICFPTFEKDSANADLIFVGKLLEATHGTYWDGVSSKSIYTFQIVESFKGMPTWRTVTSIISPVYGCCSPQFRVDSTYLIFAFAFGQDSRTAYYTNDCTLTGPLSEPETQYYYNRLGKPLQPDPSNRALENYFQQKERQADRKRAERDSLIQLHTSLKEHLKSQQRTNTLLIAALSIFGAAILFLIIQRIRSR